MAATVLPETESQSVGIVAPALTGSTSRVARPFSDVRSALERSPFLVTLVVVAFVTRAIAAIGLERWLIARGGDGFINPDERSYDRLAWQLAQSWRGIGTGPRPEDSWILNAYVYTEAALYTLVGHHPLAMKLLNCLLGALVAGLIYLIARRLFGQPAGRVAGVAAAFFPSTFLWSLTNLKDTMFVFAVALLLFLLTILISHGTWRLVLPLLAAFALVGGLRPYVQTLLGLLVPGAILLQTELPWRRKWLLTATLFGSCVILLWFSGGMQLFGIGSDQINRARYCMAAGANSAFVTSGEAAAEQCAAPEAEIAPGRSLQELIQWLPTGVAFALAAPFPWTADRLIERATIPEMIVWYAAVILAIIAAARHWRSWRQYASVLGFVGGMMLILALTQGNEGTLLRHRGMLVPFVLIFSGAGAVWLWHRWQTQRTPGTSNRNVTYGVSSLSRRSRIDF